MESENLFTPDVQLAHDLLDRACLRLGFDSNKIRHEIAERTLQGCIVGLVFSLTKRPIENTKLAGAIAMWNLYLNCPTKIVDYANLYKKYLRPDVYEFLITHADELQPHLNFELDFNNIYFSVGTLIETYLARLSYDEAPNEVPQMAFLRIAAGKFCSTRKNLKGEQIGDPVADTLKMYRRYANREMTPSSPTFFNEGFKDGAPISCMIYTIDDSLDDIFAVLYEAQMASKNSAGLGVDFTSLRHSTISRKGTSQGIIPLLKIWDDTVKYVNQGGSRNGAATASIRCFHYDLPEFVRLLDKTNEDATRVSRLNLSLMVSDLFMKRVYTKGATWRFFCPKHAKELVTLHGKEFEKKYLEMEQHAETWERYEKYRYMTSIATTRTPEMEARYLEFEKEFKDKPKPRQMISRVVNAESQMRSICDMQIKSGGPYIVYSCNVNRKNSMMNVGPVRSSNLCQETMIPAVPREQTGSCNLAALSLVAFARENGTFDYLHMAQVVKDAIIGLNKIIDTAVNVSEKVKCSNDLSRPLGLGVSGFSDALAVMDLPVTDPKSIPITGNMMPDYSRTGLLRRTLNPIVDDFNWKVWSCMYYNALKASMEEAKEFGPCPKFAGSPASEGRLQYHLWQEEAAETGRKYPFKLYPAEPSEWGQDGSWEWLVEEIKTFGLRNLLLLSVQPTASSAQIIGTCESVEFHVSNIYTRKVKSGDYPIFNHHMVSDLEKINAWNSQTYNNIITNDGSLLQLPEDSVVPEHVARLRHLKEKYMTMWETPQRIMVKLAAQRQICVCQSQSMNLYIAQPTIEQLLEVHKHTWKMGLKTGMYYLRTKAAAEPLKIGKDSIVSDDSIAHINKKVKDMLLVEHHDTELIELAELARKQKEADDHKIRSNRDDMIDKALLSEVRPTDIGMCFKAEDCIMCK